DLADGLAGEIDAVEAGATEEGFGGGEFDDLAGFELLGDGCTIIAEQEGIKNGGGIRLRAGERMMAVEPTGFLWIQRGQLDGHFFPCIRQQGDAGGVAADKLGLKRPSIGAFPWA